MNNSSLQLINKLSIKYPIFLSPMSGVSTIEMSNKFASCNGLSSIPFGSINLKTNQGLNEIKSIIDKFQHGNKVNLNFFCHSLIDKPTMNQIQNLKQLYNSTIGISEVDYTINGNISFHESNPELIDYLINFQPKIISFHFGHPSKSLIKRFQSNGIMIFITATSLNEVKKLIELKVDGIILQGYEAGGHRGNFINIESDEKLSTMDLFKTVKEYINDSSVMPFLVVSGGIHSNDQIKQYLNLGASGVQIGSIFLSTPESTTYKFFSNKENLNKPTIMTDLVSGKHARTVETDFIKQLKSNYKNDELTGYGYRYNSYKELKSKYKDSDIGFYLTGENFKYNKIELSIEQIMNELTKDLNLDN